MEKKKQISKDTITKKPRVDVPIDTTVAPPKKPGAGAEGSQAKPAQKSK